MTSSSLRTHTYLHSKSWILALALLVLAGLLASFTVYSWKITRASVDLEIAHINRIATQNYQSLQQRRFEGLRAAGLKLLTLQQQDPAGAEQLLKTVIDISSGLRSVIFLNEERQPLLYVNRNERSSQELPDTTQFSEEIASAINSGSMTSAAPVWDTTSGEWLLPLFVAVKDPASGRLRGVAAAWVSLQDRVGSWGSIDLGQETSIAILGDDGIPRYVAPHANLFASAGGHEFLKRILGLIETSSAADGWVDAGFPQEKTVPDTEYRVHYSVIGPGLYSLVVRPYSFYYGAMTTRMQPAVWLFLLLSVITVAMHFVVQGQQSRYRDRLEFEVDHDPLTGLLNRTRLLRLMNHSIRQSPDEPMILIMVNLDHFNRVNDQHGHAMGDAVLQQAALRLRSVIGEDDWLARHSGDEFMVVLRSENSLRSEDMLIMAMHAALQEVFEVSSHTIRVSASIGVAHYPHDGSCAEELLGKADAALHKAKNDGRGQVVSYSNSIGRQLQREKVLERQLDGCCSRSEMRVHYQPQVDCRSGELIGAEALVRWNNPELGSVSPAEFIPVAEKTGMIADIDCHVMREACGFVQQLSELCQKPLRMSVNLSASHLLDPGLLDEIRELIRNFALEPQQLVLEITETAMLSDFERAAQQVHQLRALGVGISVDDFGTGYSSLAYIHRLPVTEIKIDRSFVDQITSDLHDRALTSAIIAMGKRLNLEVVAEGVEDADQWQILLDQHCDTVQGYHIARPMTGDDFVRFALKNRQAGNEMEAVSAVI